MKVQSNMKAFGNMRSGTLGVIAAIGIVIAAILIGSAVNSNASSGEDSAISAPQQTVAELSAIRTGIADAIVLFGVAGAAVMLALVFGLRSERDADEAALISSAQRKRCPHCAELVRPQATVCRFCSRDLVGADGEPSP